jgi:FtsP/CotA-like multicopper oxidase with cupredoxin domain
MAVALVVAMGFSALYRGRSSAAADSSSPTGSQAAMPAMTGGSGDQSDPSGTMSAKEMASMHQASMKAFPAKTAGLGGRALKATIEHGVKIFRLMAMPTKWEVTPGQFVTAWAYNNQVPGPEIRVRRGDRIRVILTNHLPEPTVTGTE